MYRDPAPLRGVGPAVVSMDAAEDVTAHAPAGDACVIAGCIEQLVAADSAVAACRAWTSHTVRVARCPGPAALAGFRLLTAPLQRALDAVVPGRAGGPPGGAGRGTARPAARAYAGGAHRYAPPAVDAAGALSRVADGELAGLRVRAGQAGGPVPGIAQLPSGALLVCCGEIAGATPAWAILDLERPAAHAPWALTAAQVSQLDAIDLGLPNGGTATAAGAVSA